MKRKSKMSDRPVSSRKKKTRIQIFEINNSSWMSFELLMDLDVYIVRSGRCELSVKTAVLSSHVADASRKSFNYSFYERLIGWECANYGPQKQILFFFCFQIKLKTHSREESAHGEGICNLVIIKYTHRGTGRTAVHKYSLTQIPRQYLQISRITIIPQFSQRWSIELALSHWPIDKPTLCGDNTSPKRHET